MRAALCRGFAMGLVAVLAMPVLAQRVAVRQRAASVGGSDAAVHSTGELLGLVTDATGRPQAGALVMIRAGRLNGAVVKRMTGRNGVFDVAGLAPGVYYVDVGKGRRTAARQSVRVHASERALLLVNLPELLKSARFGVPPGQPPDASFDWALRQAAEYKPVLRWQQEAPQAAPEGVDGYVALTAGGGSNAFDVPDLATEFRVDSSLLGEQMSLSGDVGTNGAGGGSDTRLVASFRSRDFTNPARLSVATRVLSIPGRPVLPSLRIFTVNYGSALNLADNFRVQYGAIANAVTLTDTVATFDPFVRVQHRVGKQGQLEYRAVSAVPPVRFTRDSADMPDPTPQVSLDHNRARIERAYHQELSYSDSLTPNLTLAGAVFDEHFSRTAVDGTYSLSGAAPSDAATLSGLMPDLLNNMFVADGGDYGGWGYRVEAEQRLGGTWTAGLSFSDGMALAPASVPTGTSLAGGLTPVRAEALTAKLSGIIPHVGTRLVCSYRALSRPTATALDPYDDTPMRSDAYANIYVRQPLPRVFSGSSGRLAALLEIHNLLAQGYIPMITSDGQTIYLVQSARSLRGGFTFSF